MIETTETEDDSRAKQKTTTTKKRAMETAEATVDQREGGAGETRSHVDAFRLPNSRNEVEPRPDTPRHRALPISIPWPVKVNRVIKRPEKTTISNRNF